MFFFSISILIFAENLLPKLLFVVEFSLVSYFIFVVVVGILKQN